MNILTVNKFYWLKGGSETVFFAEKKLLEEHGHTVVPFSMEHGNNIPSSYSRYFVSNTDFETNGFNSKLKIAANVIYSIEAKKKMSELLRVYKPDIAHLHNFQHQISPSIFHPLKNNNIPIILTMHDLKPVCPAYTCYRHGNLCEKCFNRKFYNCTLNKCTKDSYFKSFVNTVEMYLHYHLKLYQSVNKFITVSKFYRQKMLENGFPENKVLYLPNFIDLKNYKISTNDEGYVLYFGRLSDEKGVDTLLKSASNLPEIKFKIAGNGPMDHSLRKNYSALSNVEFLGYITGKYLENLITNSSLTVIPSRWYENCPMSVLESFAYGKPVIGANIGGIPELINEGNDGLTFESLNDQDLSHKIIQLMSKTKAIRMRMGMEGRIKLSEEFNAETHYEKLIQLYNSMKQ